MLFAIRIFLCAAALAGIVSAAPVAAQQRIVQIPPAAKRGMMAFQGGNEVVIDGRVRLRMAPGVRIFDRNNMLAMYGALNGTFRVKYQVEELSGMLLTVWILTDAEIATPDPAPKPAPKPTQ